MAYEIIFFTYCFIQYTLLDFFNTLTIEVIDCRTLEGQQRFLEIYGRCTFNRMTQRFNQGLPEQHYLGEIGISKPLLQGLFSHLHERTKRLVAAFLLLSISVKNRANFAKFVGLDVKTLRTAVRELLSGGVLPGKRIRRPGGGRKPKSQEYKTFRKVLGVIAEDHLAGDPSNGHRWVRKSLRYFQTCLRAFNIRASLPTIRKYLREQKISLKGTVKNISTQHHPDRDRQFRRVNTFKRAYLRAGKPVISIDTKKKEQIGLFHQAGRLWRKAAARVFDHDFANLREGKAIPFGIYDLTHNQGYIYCGTSHETSQFLVEMIAKWWQEVGQVLYPNQTSLLILCDAGGANGYRRRGWKWELATQLARPFGLKVTVCHYPPGASKWNPIEHKLFSFISLNWAGEPLTSYEKMLDFINSTTTQTGLTVKGVLIEKAYPTKIKYTDAQMAEIQIHSKKILPQWNYTILPT